MNKTKVSKIFNIIAYIFIGAVVVFGGFTVYDWFKFELYPEFWDLVHSNAKLILITAIIGIIFPISNYIMNFSDQENKSFKNKAEVIMSFFIVAIIIAIVLLASPIEFNF